MYTELQIQEHYYCTLKTIVIVYFLQLQRLEWREKSSFAIK